jgi:hypothetical protein
LPYDGIEHQAGGSKERRLAVKLEIILSLQYVVEQTKSTADAGLAIPTGIPRKSDRPAILIPLQIIARKLIVGIVLVKNWLAFNASLRRNSNPLP